MIACSAGDNLHDERCERALETACDDQGSEESPDAVLRCRTVSEFVHAVTLALPALARRCVAAAPLRPLAFESVVTYSSSDSISSFSGTAHKLDWTDGAQRSSGPADFASANACATDEVPAAASTDDRRPPDATSRHGARVCGPERVPDALPAL